MKHSNRIITMTEKEIVKADFKSYFDKELKQFEVVKTVFENKKNILII